MQIRPFFYPFLVKNKVILLAALLSLLPLMPSCTAPVPDGRSRVAALPEQWRPLGKGYLHDRNNEALGCLEFLLATMPHQDEQGMDPALLAENIEFALKARHAFPWCRQLPREVFLNEVLPYAVLDEHRDAWRRDFFNKFSPLMKNCRSTTEAVLAVQSNILAVTGVSYNTGRRAPNQSPAESMEQGKASCTGLSILLVDACRAVGVPSRLAGVLTWSDLSGNHNWVEVYCNDSWRFTEYGGTVFDRGWLLERLVNVDGSDPRFAVFATSWKPAEDWFPMAWKLNPKQPFQWPVSMAVPAVNVSSRYQQLARQQLGADLERRTNLTPVRIVVLDAAGNRLAARVTAVQDASETSAVSAISLSQADDLNHHLDIFLAPNRDYSITAEIEGHRISEHIHVMPPSSMPQTVKLVF
jgi:hypothetical protein